MTCYMALDHGHLYYFVRCARDAIHCIDENSHAKVHFLKL